MEHISEHLKAHASNDSDFRALIGEPRMGKVGLLLSDLTFKPQREGGNGVVVECWTSDQEVPSSNPGQCQKVIALCVNIYHH